MKEELDVIKTMEMLVRLNIVRLNRATEQLNTEPHHIELSKISAEIRQELQSLFLMKHRWCESDRKIETM